MRDAEEEHDVPDIEPGLHKKRKKRKLLTLEVRESELASASSEGLQTLAKRILEVEFDVDLILPRRVDWTPMIVYLDMLKDYNYAREAITRNAWWNIFAFYPEELLKGFLTREKTPSHHPDFKNLAKLYARAANGRNWD